jgi:drug/metabolite transporter (DMT)-like permease
MEYYHINSFGVAFVYALAAVFSKSALEQGCGILRLSFIMNLVFALIFSSALGWQMEGIDLSKLYLPVVAGALFFVGHVFTFAAIRMGDVSLQTPIMGTKAIFVALIAVVTGAQEVNFALGLAAVLAALAVALLGFSGGQAKKVGLTITLSLVSAFSFACFDQMAGIFGGSFGKNSFLVIVMLVNAVLSFFLIPFFNAPLRQIERTAWPWVMAASVGMALQALVLTYTLAASGEVVVVNIIYSARGFFSVLIGLVIGLLFTLQIEQMSRRVRIQRILGALIISVAIAIALTA